jgi:hypothetical protein
LERNVEGEKKGENKKREGDKKKLMNQTWSEFN